MRRLYNLRCRLQRSHPPQTITTRSEEAPPLASVPIISPWGGPIMCSAGGGEEMFPWASVDTTTTAYRSQYHHTASISPPPYVRRTANELSAPGGTGRPQSAVSKLGRPRPVPTSGRSVFESHWSRRQLQCLCWWLCWCGVGTGGSGGGGASAQPPAGRKWWKGGRCVFSWPPCPPRRLPLDTSPCRPYVTTNTSPLIDYHWYITTDSRLIDNDAWRTDAIYPTINASLMQVKKLTICLHTTGILRLIGMRSPCDQTCNVFLSGLCYWEYTHMSTSIGVGIRQALFLRYSQKKTLVREICTFIVGWDTIACNCT